MHVFGNPLDNLWQSCETPMKQKLLLISFVLNFLSTNGFGQELTIIIDSLEGYSGAAEISRLIGTCNGVQDYLNDEASEEILISFDAHPKVVARFPKKGHCCLLLDNKGGLFRFGPLQNFASDTLRLAKWTVYKNGLPDTTSGVKIIQPMIIDSVIQDQVVTKPFVSVKTNKGGQAPEYLNLSINGSKIQTRVTIESKGLYKTFSGCEPRRVCEDYMKHAEKSNRVFRYRLLDGESTTNFRVFSSSLAF